jgi:hypothetical protein
MVAIGILVSVGFWLGAPAPLPSGLTPASLSVAHAAASALGQGSHLVEPAAVAARSVAGSRWRSMAGPCAT